MKTLHIVAYEKFLSHVMEISETVNPGQNRYIVCGATGKTSYAPPVSATYRAQPHAFRLDAASREDIEWCDALFLHPMTGSTSAALRAARSDCVTVWCGMGGDYYKYWGDFRDHLYLPHTQNALDELRSNKKKGVAAHIKRWLPKSNKRHTDPALQVASRIDFFCVSETNVVLDHLPGFRAEKLGDFGYYTYEAALSLGAEPLDGNDILIGNSAYPTNNHIDIFEQLRHVDLKGGKLVLPLSYGPSSGYADVVQRHAESLFGAESVIALTDWLPVTEYNRVLNRCTTVIMNHNRGQAMGNIVSMMIRGARVHLRPKNPYGRFLEGLGVGVARLAEGDLDGSILEPLSDAEKAWNKKTLIDYWSKAAMTQRTANLFERIGKEVEKRKT